MLYLGIDWQRLGVKMAKFKSKYNGTIIEFTNEHDIVELRKHSEYMEVIDAEWETKDEGRDSPRTLDTGPISSHDKEGSLPVKTRLRRKHKK